MPSGCGCCWTSSPTTPPTSTRGSRPRSPPGPARRSARATCSARPGATASAAQQLGERVRRAGLDPRPSRRPAVVPAPVRRPRSRTSTGTTRRCGPTSSGRCGSGSTAASTGSASTSPTRWSRTAGCPTWRRANDVRARPPSVLGPRRACTTSTARWRRDRRRVRPAAGRSSPRRGSPDPERLARYLRPDELHTAFTSTTCSRPRGSPRTCARRSTRRWPSRGGAAPRDVGAVQPRRRRGSSRGWRASPTAGRGRGSTTSSACRPTWRPACAAHGPPR